ncbi:MAG: DUF370 domain-containing protein [Clostridia bacterium]|nr:DUF370 domain-containing protein [Clostridia bacterium]MBR0536896.1 DUF370 domain-containing protein [Clostridia bacterium]
MGYLDLGGKAVAETEIVGIFDLDTASVAKRTRDYLNTAQKSGAVQTLTFDLPKSFIVTEEPGGQKVYISQFSAGTLAKRVSE